MSSKLASLGQQELLSRLSLNLTNDYVKPEKLQSLSITIIDVFDHSANSSSTRQELYKMYPNARRAHLRNGGNFPYLSRSDEVNMHLLVHLRQFNNTERASCVHFLDLREDDDDNRSSLQNSLENSVELARIAEEMQDKMQRKTEKIVDETEDSISTQENQESNQDQINDSTTQLKESVVAGSQVDHLV